MRTFSVLLLALAPSLSGCISVAVYNHTRDLVDVTHRPDRVVAAYRLSDGDVAIQLEGRRSGREHAADFWILVPAHKVRVTKEKTRPEYLRCSSDEECGYWSRNGLKGFPPYRPSFRDAPPQNSDGWQRLEVIQADAIAIGHRAPESLPAIYVTPNTFSPDLMGTIQLAYLEPYRDSYVFRWDIEPDAAVYSHDTEWLLLTVPADVVTLPLQVVWGLLFAVSMMGAR